MSTGSLVTVKITAVDTKRVGKYVTVGEKRADGSFTNTNTYKATREGVFHFGTPVRRMVPPPCLLKLPHKEGQRWESEVTVKDKKFGGEHKEVWSCVATGPEELKVPAGVYRAIKVHTVVSTNGTKRDEFTNWYAPEVGLVKASYLTQATVVDLAKAVELELKAFKVKSNSPK